MEVMQYLFGIGYVITETLKRDARNFNKVLKYIIELNKEANASDINQ